MTDPETPQEARAAGPVEMAKAQFQAMVDRYRHAEGRRGQRQAGFTLIELVIVLVILGILASIAVPQFVGVQEQAQRNAKATEAASLLSEAYSEARLDGDDTPWSGCSGAGGEIEDDIGDWSVTSGSEGDAATFKLPGVEDTWCTVTEGGGDDST